VARQVIEPTRATVGVLRNPWSDAMAGDGILSAILQTATSAGGMVPLSAALIATGVVLILRDMRAGRRHAASLKPDESVATVSAAASPAPPAPLPAVAAVITPSPAPSVPPAANNSTPLATPPALATLEASIAAIVAEASEIEAGQPDRERLPALETHWQLLQPRLSAAIDRVNTSLKPVAAEVGASGTPAWSFGNSGFGSYRRVSVAGRSIAWLRTEIGHDGALSLKVRAHKDDQVLLNCSSKATLAVANSDAITEALARCLAPAAAFAAWNLTRLQDGAALETYSWGDLQPLLNQALAVANGALVEARASIRPRQPAIWDSTIDRFRWPLDVTVDTHSVALMHIDLLTDVLEISVGVADPNRLDLARRHRIDIAGLTPHAAAEILASAAWPAIAGHLQGVMTRQPVRQNLAPQAAAH
jgi:hypothetical protein